MAKEPEHPKRRSTYLISSKESISFIPPEENVINKTFMNDFPKNDEGERCDVLYIPKKENNLLKKLFDDFELADNIRNDLQFAYINMCLEASLPSLNLNKFIKEERSESILFFEVFDEVIFKKNRVLKFSITTKKNKKTYVFKQGSTLAFFEKMFSAFISTEDFQSFYSLYQSFKVNKSVDFFNGSKNNEKYSLKYHCKQLNDYLNKALQKVKFNPSTVNKKRNQRLKSSNALLIGKLMILAGYNNNITPDDYDNHDPEIRRWISNLIES